MWILVIINLHMFDDPTTSKIGTFPTYKECVAAKEENQRIIPTRAWECVKETK